MAKLLCVLPVNSGSTHSAAATKWQPPRASTNPHRPRTCDPRCASVGAVASALHAPDPQGSLRTRTNH